MKHKHLNHLNIVSPNDRLACAMQWLPGTELSAATFVAVPHGAALSVDFVNSYDSWNSAYSKLEVHSLQAGRLDAACVSVRCFILRQLRAAAAAMRHRTPVDAVPVQAAESSAPLLHSLLQEGIGLPEVSLENWLV